MKINTSFLNFKKKHQSKKNQIIFYKTNCKSNKIIENIINNFLIKKNSFIFESVEKRRIRGRYTIVGADPDKIWEFDKKKIHLSGLLTLFFFSLNLLQKNVDFYQTS